ncbi:Hypothetical predicted protein [Mytilus galloprovincialis]|uniref:CCHC-type domain-containing protein n=1 Tax=Mytilus galloprovincialis TaxID=29158 RepID=A0A8B6BT89_MYTGA|nr:Hypothetical predicted protein [Mytilus galloprovincialis]
MQDAEVVSNQAIKSEHTSKDNSEILKLLTKQQEMLEKQQQQIDRLSNRSNVKTYSDSTNNDVYNSHKPIVCYNCGGKGHKRPECPSAFQAQRSDEDTQKTHTRGQFRGRGRGYRGRYNQRVTRRGFNRTVITRSLLIDIDTVRIKQLNRNIVLNDVSIKTMLPRYQKVRPSMGSLIACKPLDILAMDFTVLEKSSDGRENVLVLTDVFTKFTQAFPTRDQKATTVHKVLVKAWFLKLGIPKRLHSDHGRNFEGVVIRELCRIYDIKKITQNTVQTRRKRSN